MTPAALRAATRPWRWITERLGARRARPQQPAADPELRARLQTAGAALDQAFADSLGTAVQQAEQSTTDVMAQMRALSDRTTELLASVDAAMADAGQQEQQVARDVALLARVADFLHDLPNRVRRDMETLASIGAEIKSLSGLAESVQSIAMQSHLLSLNAAIEATRAGPAGVTFKVVADEMRTLAANSHAAASQIGGTLQRARRVLEDGMEVNSSASAQEFREIAAVADHVRDLQSGLDRISSSYRAPFDAVAQHGVALASGTAEVLGAMQFQDILRQHVERMIAANGERGALVAALCARAGADPAVIAVANELEALLRRYTEEEARHGRAASGDDGGGALMIELF